MQCQRLLKQTKAWYIHVSNETMAPARMISFIKEHAASCDICLKDPDLEEEIEKITEMILPESKIPKAVRMQQEQEEMEKQAASEESIEEENDAEGDDAEEDDGGDDGGDAEGDDEKEVTDPGNK